VGIALAHRSTPRSLRSLGPGLHAGGVKCWGGGALGQLGNGTTTTSQMTPVDVTGLNEGVSSISSGSEHVCAVLQSGGAKCWGYGGNRALGDGGTTTRTTPVSVVD